MRVNSQELNAVVAALNAEHETAEEKAKACIDAFMEAFLQRTDRHILLSVVEGIGNFAWDMFPTRGDAQRYATWAIPERMAAHRFIVRVQPRMRRTEEMNTDNCPRCGHPAYGHGHFVKKRGCGVDGCQCQETSIPRYRSHQRKR